VALHPASFRDPSGHVHLIDDRVLRTVLEPGRDDYEFVRDTGLPARLVERGWLVGATELPPHEIDAFDDEAGAPCHVLQHPRLRVISYPYEWSFPALRDAALLQLDVHLAALEDGVSLSDASAYNVMFDGARPVFIDYLSFRRYRDGEFWAGHRQFCEQYLNPLLLTAYTGVPFQPWYRGSMEGIPPGHLARLLPLRRRWSWRVFTHVTLQSSLQQPARTDQAAAAMRRKLPLASLKGILGSLRRWVATLEPLGSRASVWAGYASDNSYTAAEAGLKRQFVERFADRVRPELLLDIGCNTGDYSVAALRAGAASAVGWESDPGALDGAYRRARDEGLNFLPLWGDAVNPSPAQGWSGVERPSLPERIDADAVLALALIHHMAIARNVPLASVIDWLVDRAPNGIIEFVPKSDPMVRQLLALRADIFPDYSEEAFLHALGRRGTVVETLRLPNSGRLLAWYHRE
jgi:ribosomal protein L11 methylase PrmA